MNRSVSLHPLSLVLGVLFGVIVLLSMSQVSPLNTKSVVVQYGPNAHDYVQVREGTPFVVPAGKLFVVTALGQSTLPSCGTSPLRTFLKINGTPEATTWSGICGGGGDLSSVIHVASGLTATAGSTIEVDSDAGGTGLARAWGYIAPQ
jgi:hypothetical protein